MSFENLASRLGVRYQRLPLEAGEKKHWRHSSTAAWDSVEAAALAHFVEKEGWSGDHREGGLILSLIKAASFHSLPWSQRSTFVEALYNQFIVPRDRPAYRIREEVEVARLVETVSTASIERIRANFAVMAVTPAGTPEYCPTVTLTKLEGVFRALGPERLHSIAKIFATAPYDLRAGWPDLTLWRGDEVAFREIKTSGDRFHRSQERLIRTILLPLGFDVVIVEVPSG